MNGNSSKLIEKLNQRFEELLAQEQHKDAIDLGIELVELTSEIDGEDHFNYIEAKGKLANLYRLTNQFYEAELLYQEVYNFCNYQNMVNEYFLKTTINLADAKEQNEKSKEAFSLYKDAVDLGIELIELTRENDGEDHFNYIEAKGNVAYLYRQTNQFEEAELLYQEVYDFCNFQNMANEYFIKVTFNLAEAKEQNEKFKEAFSLYQYAISGSQKLLGEENPLHIHSLKKLAELYIDLDKYESAKPLIKKLVSIQEKTLGGDHPDLLYSLNDLGFLYNQLGEYASAVSPLEKAIEIIRKTLGEDHPSLADSLKDLGLLYSKLGKYTSAVPPFEQAIEIERKVLDEGHPELADSLNNLAFLYNKLGNYVSAEPLFKQAIKIKRGEFGKGDIRLTKTLNNLGSLYENMGDYVLAESFFREALEIRQKVLGEEHPACGVCLDNLATVLELMGNYVSAELLYKESLEMTRKVKGDYNEDFVTSLHNLGSFYHNKGDYRSAELMLKQALEIGRRVSDEGKNAATLHQLGLLYADMNDFESAEPLLEKAIEIWRSVLYEDRNTAAGLLTLGRLYADNYDYTSAESLYKESIEIYRRIVGEDHPNFAESLNNLGVLYSQMGDYVSAKPILKKSLEINRKVLGEDHSEFSNNLFNLGILHIKLGNYALAEPLLKQALEIGRSGFGDEHPLVANYIDGLSFLYAATQREEKAFLLMKRAIVIDDRMIRQVFSIGSERQRMDFLSIHDRIHIFLSFVLKHSAELTGAVESAAQLILRRKAIGAEALSSQSDLIYGNQKPHLAPLLRELNDLRMQIVKRTLSGPGPEGLAAHLRFVEQLEIKKEKLESNLVKEIPQMDLKKRLENSDIKAVSSLLPGSSVLVEFFRFDVYNFNAILANGDELWLPPQYLAFVIFSDNQENIKMIDLGDAEIIDKFISDYRTEIIHNPSERLNRDMTFVQTKVNPANNSDVGHKLQKILFEPILRAIGDIKRIFLAPDSDLSKLPFETLPMKNSCYLIDEYQISYLGVGRDLLRLEAKSNGLASQSIVVADPNFDLGIDDESSFSQFDDKLIPISIKEKHQKSKINQENNALPSATHTKSNIIAFPGTKLSKSELKPVQETNDKKISLTTNRVARNFERNDIIFNRLPGTKEEGEAIAKILDVQPMMNNQALESIIKNHNSPRIMHIASHGFFLSDQKRKSDNNSKSFNMFNSKMGFANRNFSASKLENPMLRSGLALAGINTWLKGGQPPAEAEDGILTAEDITGLNLTATELVVLSACETGIGEIKTGEGVFGLRRAFTIAGTKTLVMSLWKVPDEQTKELMINFYERLINGETRSEALKNAQLEIRKQYPDPYYWGAFICQGDPGPLKENYNSQIKE